MCGICGVVNLKGPLQLAPGAAERMIGALRHRGPDEFGAWRDDRALLGHARLSIIDLAGGQQPMSTAEQVADAVLLAASGPGTEIAMPRRSGRLATLAYLFPALARKMRPALRRRGAKAKDAFRRRRDGGG